MTDIFFSVQQAIYNVLAGSTALQAIIGNPPRLYDHVPPGAVLPYVAFGAMTAQPFDTKTETGFEQIVTLNIWSRYRGAKETHDILQVIYDTLHRRNLTVSGVVFLSCEFHSVDITGLDDGLTTHAAVRYEVITQST
jgi:hypothetical protein